MATPQNTTQATSLRMLVRCQSSCSTALRRDRLSGALPRAEEDERDVDERRAHDHAERDQEGDLAKRLARLEPADRHEVGNHRPAHEAADDCGDADARADDHAGAEGRRGKIDRAQECGLGRADAAGDAQRHAAEEARHRLLAAVPDRSARAGCSRPRARTETSAGGDRRESACRACRRRRRTCRCKACTG